MVIDKESVYDEEISPLVQQIIEICQRESIPFVMDFGLREGDENTEAVYCMSAMHGHPGMMRTPAYPGVVRALGGETECAAIALGARRGEDG
jgi:hypothetical protein